MSEVDGMGNIERSPDPNDRAADPEAWDREAYRRQLARAIAAEERVVVLTAQLAGAVDRIAGLEAALRLALARGTFDATDAVVLRAALPDQRGQSEAEGPVPREWTLRASGDINGGTGQCERSIHAAGPELRGIKPVRVREIPS